MTQSVPLYRA